MSVRIKPDVGDAWRLLGDHLSAMGDGAAADDAYANHVRHSKRDPRLLAPATALCENRIPEAESVLREHLKRHPTDVAAIRMLAEVAARIGRYADAENLLARCLELAPGFAAVDAVDQGVQALPDLRDLQRFGWRLRGHAVLLRRGRDGTKKGREGLSRVRMGGQIVTLICPSSTVTG